MQVLGPLRGTDRDPFEGAEVDANALGWALAVVTSRAFRTRGPGQVGGPPSLRWAGGVCAARGLSRSALCSSLDGQPAGH